MHIFHFPHIISHLAHSSSPSLHTPFIIIPSFPHPPSSSSLTTLHLLSSCVRFARICQVGHRIGFVGCMTSELQFLGYKGWRGPSGNVVYVGKFFCDLSSQEAGSLLWVDVTHWYYSVYESPYQNVNDRLFRLWKRWEERVQHMQLHKGIERGPRPRSSLSSLWGLTCELFSARTVTAKRMNTLIHFWSVMWLDVLERSNAESITKPDTVFIGANGSLEATTIDALKMKVPPATQPCIDKVLERIGCIDRLTLPEFILAVIRVSTLMPFYADECMSVAVVLTGGLIGLIEKIFLAHSATLLSEALPVGAQERYSYHSGRARTCPDPRTQVVSPVETCR